MMSGLVSWSKSSSASLLVSVIFSRLVFCFLTIATSKQAKRGDKDTLTFSSSIGKDLNSQLSSVDDLVVIHFVEQVHSFLVSELDDDLITAGLEKLNVTCLPHVRNRRRAYQDL